MAASYRLPDGKYTTDWRKYVSAWRALGTEVCEAFAEYREELWHLVGWDPGLLLRNERRSLDIPSEVALLIHSMLRSPRED